MRVWPILGVALLTAACYESTSLSLSLQPLLGEENFVDVPQIVGSWVKAGEKPEVLTFERAEDKVYVMSVADAGAESRGGLLVVFGRVGDGEALYWNLTAAPGENESSLWTQHRLPVHTFARVVLDGDRLEIAHFQQKWLKAVLEDSRVEIAHAIVDGNVILTASPAELQQLLREHGDDEGAFGEPQVFLRRTTNE